MGSMTNRRKAKARPVQIVPRDPVPYEEDRDAENLNEVFHQDRQGFSAAAQYFQGVSCVTILRLRPGHAW